MHKSISISKIAKLIVLAITFSVLSGCSVCHQGIGTSYDAHNNISGEYIVELQNANKFRVHYDGDDWPRGDGELVSVFMTIITSSEQEAVYATASVPSLFNETDPDDVSDGELEVGEGDKVRVEWSSPNPFYVRATRGEAITIRVRAIENDPRGHCEAGTTNFSFTVPNRILDLPETCQAENTYFLSQNRGELLMTIANWPLVGSRIVGVNTTGEDAGPELILAGDPVICLRRAP